MKVYTKLVMDWDGNVLEEESHEYDGPVTECKGGGDSTSTTVQKADPWAGVQPYLKKGYAQADALFNRGGPQYYPGQTHVNRDSLENNAQQMALSYAQNHLPYQSLDAQTAQAQMLRAPDVANNQYVGGMADVIQSRLADNLTGNVLPSIRSGAVAGGQLGGSRQALAQAKAINENQQATGDALAQLYGGAYSEGLQQQARGMAFVPQTMQAGLEPAKQIAGVGEYNRGERELDLQGNIDRWNFNQQRPYQNLQSYMGMLQGAPWGSSSTSEMGGGSRSGFNTSGAVGGAMLGNMIMPGLGGIIGGGLLGGLF